MIDAGIKGDVLFHTIVGSHLWNCARPDSDVDEFVCYALPTRDILLGKEGMSFHKPGLVDPADNKEHDLAIHEAGVIVHQLLKGNPNFLIGVFSNKSLYEPLENSFGLDDGSTTWLSSLRAALDGNISKNCYNAFKGSGVGHYLKYIESGKDASERRCNIGVRFFNFGISLLLTGKPDFTPIPKATPDMVFNKFDALQRAYAISSLPERPEQPKKLEDWLLMVRTRKFMEWFDEWLE